MKILDAVLVHPSKIHYIPGSLAIADARHVSLRTLSKKVNDLRKRYDFVLIDGSPGLDNQTIYLMKASDEVIIVTNPEITALTDAIKVIEVARKEKVKIRGIILNRVREKEFELRVQE